MLDINHDFRGFISILDVFPRSGQGSRPASPPLMGLMEDEHTGASLPSPPRSSCHFSPLHHNPPQPDAPAQSPVVFLASEQPHESKTSPGLASGSAGLSGASGSAGTAPRAAAVSGSEAQEVPV